MELDVDSKQMNGVLTNVLYAPELQRNFFTIGKALSEGMELHFHSQYMTFLNKNKPVITATRSKNLYNINSKTMMPDKYTANVADVDIKGIHLWHKHLGHMGMESMKSMISNGIVNGIPHLKNKELFCEDCTVNKMVRQPFQETT